MNGQASKPAGVNESRAEGDRESQAEGGNAEDVTMAGQTAAEDPVEHKEQEAPERQPQQGLQRGGQPQTGQQPDGRRAWGPALQGSPARLPHGYHALAHCPPPLQHQVSDDFPLTPLSPLQKTINLLQQTSLRDSHTIPLSSFPPTWVNKQPFSDEQFYTYGGLFQQKALPMNPELLREIYESHPFSTLLAADDFHAFSPPYQAFLDSQGKPWPPGGDKILSPISSFLEVQTIPSDFLFTPLSSNIRRGGLPNLTDMCLHLASLLEKATTPVKAWVILPSFDATITPDNSHSWDPRTAYLKLEKFLVAIDAVTVHHPLQISGKFEDLVVAISPVPASGALTILFVDSTSTWQHRPGKTRLGYSPGYLPRVQALIQKARGNHPLPLKS